MTADSKTPNELKLCAGQVTETLVLIGPSIHGWVYRQRNSQACYRRMPMADVPLARRQAVKAWVDTRLPAGVAPVTWAGQPDDTSGHYYVRYKVPSFDRTLADVLADADIHGRIQYTARALAALPGWWRDLYCPLMPLPADIAYAHDGTVYLLAIPQWRPPVAEAVFQEPALALYLPPEFVRGQRNQSPEDVDRYFVGAALMQCFFAAPATDDPGNLLLRAAGGTTYEEADLADSVPFWFNRVWAAGQAVDCARRLVSPNPAVRHTLDPAKLAGQLTDWLRQMDPEAAAVSLRDNGKPRDAYGLLQDVLATHESYNLLVLAGEIAGKYLSRPLEAVDLFERAIVKEPHRPEAREGQFRAISAGRLSPQFRALMEKGSPACSQMDARIKRDFDALSTAKQESSELSMAEYLLWRGLFDDAAVFIHPRLYDGQGHYLWWKFPLTFAYAEALIGQKRYQEGRAFLAGVRKALDESRRTGGIEEGEYRSNAQVLAALELKLHHKAQGG